MAKKTNNFKVIEFTNKQKEFYRLVEEKSTSIVLFGGAIRGGKTYSLIFIALTYCTRYNNFKCILIRKSYSTITATLLPTLLNIFNEHNFWQYVKTYNKSTNCIIFNNGSEIRIMAESYETDKELNKFKGLEANMFLVDEANELSGGLKTIHKLQERAGSWFHSDYQGIGKVLMSCNPTQGWLKQFIYDKYVDGTLPAHIKYLPSKITDNPFVPKEFLEGLKNMTPLNYQIFVEGKWDVSEKKGGEFYKYFDMDKHVKNDFNYDKNSTLYLSFDDNVNPYLPCLISQFKNDKTVIFLDEISMANPHNNIFDMCKKIIEKYNQHAGKIVITGDATSSKNSTLTESDMTFYTIIRKELKKHFTNVELKVNSSNSLVTKRGEFINQILYNNFCDINIIVKSECEKLILDLSNLQEDKQGKKLKEMERKNGISYQKLGHYSDCFDYQLLSSFANEYLQFKNGGVGTFTTYSRFNDSNLGQL